MRWEYKEKVLVERFLKIDEFGSSSVSSLHDKFELLLKEIFNGRAAMG